MNMNTESSQSVPPKARRLPVPAGPASNEPQEGKPDPSTNRPSESSAGKERRPKKPPRNSTSLRTSAAGEGGTNTRKKKIRSRRRKARHTWDDLVRLPQFNHDEPTNFPCREYPPVPPPTQKPTTKRHVWATVSILSIAVTAALLVMDRSVVTVQYPPSQLERQAPAARPIMQETSDIHIDQAALPETTAANRPATSAPQATPDTDAIRTAGPTLAQQIQITQQATTTQAQVDAVNADLARARQQLTNTQASLVVLRQNASQNAKAAAAVHEQRQRLAYLDMPRTEQERAAAYRVYGDFRSQLDSAGTRTDAAARIRSAIRAQVNQLLTTAADQRRRARHERDERRQRLGAKRDDFSEAIAEAAAKVREKRWLDETVRPYEAQKVFAAIEEYDLLVACCNRAAERVNAFDVQLAESKRTLAYLEAQAQSFAAADDQITQQTAELQRQADEGELRVAELDRKAATAATTLAALKTQLAGL